MSQPPKKKIKGRSTGEDWSTTWERIEAEFPEDLHDFRTKTNLCFRLCQPVETRERWNSVCKDVPEEWKIDTLIGGSLHGPNKSASIKSSTKPIATADSIKWAYIAHKVIELLPKDRPATILEVGPGFGGAAEKICRYGNIDTYFMIDHPVMHRLQKYYMGEAGFLNKCEFSVDGSDIDTTVDLAVSTCTLSEMSMSEITEYVRLFERTSRMLYMIQYAKDSFKRIAWDKFEFTKGLWKFDSHILSGVKAELFVEVIGTKAVLVGKRDGQQGSNNS